jgi:hypothetical protein
MADNGDARRLLAVVRIAPDVPQSELVQRAQAVQSLLSRFASENVQLAFNSPDGRLFGIFFRAGTPDAVIRAELDKATTNTDNFIVCEVGDLVGQKGLGAGATWLQRN